MRPAPPMPDAQVAAITVELVRITLAGGDRPELVAPLVDPAVPRPRRRRPRR